MLKEYAAFGIKRALSLGAEWGNWGILGISYFLILVVGHGYSIILTYKYVLCTFIRTMYFTINVLLKNFIVKSVSCKQWTFTWSPEKNLPFQSFHACDSLCQNTKTWFLFSEILQREWYSPKQKIHAEVRTKGTENLRPTCRNEESRLFHSGENNVWKKNNWPRKYVWCVCVYFLFPFTSRTKF